MCRLLDHMLCLTLQYCLCHAELRTATLGGELMQPSMCAAHHLWVRPNIEHVDLKREATCPEHQMHEHGYEVHGGAWG